MSLNLSQLFVSVDEVTTISKLSQLYVGVELADYVNSVSQLFVSIDIPDFFEEEKSFNIYLGTIPITKIYLGNNNISEVIL